MTLPAYLPPMLAGQSQMSSPLAIPALRAADSTNPDDTDRAARMARRVEASGAADASLTQDAPDDLGASILEREASARRELTEIRARMEDGETVDPPVPVTQILRIVMGAPADPAPMAATGAKALYEGSGAIFARSLAAA